MNRLTEAWFEFGGVRCDTKRLRLLEIPARPHPRAKGEAQSVPGRNGELWMPEGRAWEDISITVRCETMDGYSADAIGAWLDGAGDLRFSDEPDRIYKARVREEFRRESKHQGFDRQILSVPFTCDPLRYKHLSSDGADDIDLTAAGSVNNPGTIEAAPRITVRGSGNGTVSIGGQMIRLTGMTGGGIIIDSDLMDCFDYTGAVLANHQATMEDFPTLAPGGNYISWTGGVAGVTIRPRWRYL